MKITSPDNLKIKNLKKLQAKKYRKEFGEFVVENLVIISDGLKAGHKPISLFASEDFSEKNREALEKLASQSHLNDWFEISEKINKSFSSLEHPSGICAVYKIIEPKKINFNQSILYLNSIGDPGNLGTIIRSAVAYGFKEIVLDETCADEYNYKTINAAKDAIFKVNINHDKDFKILAAIKNQMPIISTRIKQAKDIDILKKYKKLCLVVGDESKGVDEKIENLAEEFIKINISADIESLNVATATAIILNSIYNK